VLSDLTRYVNLNMASRRETEGAGHTDPGVTLRRITKVACLLAPAALLNTSVGSAACLSIVQ